MSRLLANVFCRCRSTASGSALGARVPSAVRWQSTSTPTGNNDSRSGGVPNDVRNNTNARDHLARKQKMREHGDVVDWFEKSDDLTQRRTRPDSLHIAFLEGPPGAGKKGLLDRLEKMGFTVIRKSYADTYKDNSSIRDNPHMLFVNWLSSQWDEIQRCLAQSENGSKFHENIVFVNRSPLSPAMFDPACNGNINLHFFAQAMRRLKETHNCSVLMCEADPIRLKERLGDRHASADEEMKGVRTAVFRESDDSYQELLSQRYHSVHAGIFDASLMTTDTKQATAAILKLYGIGYKWPWEKK